MTEISTRADASCAAAIDVIRASSAEQPIAGLILGTGMGRLRDALDIEAAIPYEQLPGFSRSTALGHEGQLLIGRLHGNWIVTMNGRFHIYEGYSWEEVTFPIRVMCQLGISSLIVSNAAGGLNPVYSAGDVMLIESHLNLLNSYPLGGRGDTARFPSFGASLYDKALIERAMSTARQGDFVAHRGAYVALSGPNYETRAEYRMLRALGGDVVGMSTVPEALTAAQLGVRVLGLSVVSNVARPDAPDTTTAEEVVCAASAAEPKIRAIVEDAIDSLASA